MPSPANTMSNPHGTSFEDALRARGGMRVGAIYYVSFGTDGPIKIGFVDGFGSLSERLRGLQTACPYDIVLLATKAGSMADERALHERFARKRLRGEWFDRSADLMRHINGVTRRKDCQQWLPKHPAYLPPPEGKVYVVVGKKRWLVNAPSLTLEGEG